MHHLGLVYVADAAGRSVGVRETQKLSGSFERAVVVRAAYDRMETWSQLVLDAIDGQGNPAEGTLRAPDRLEHQ